MKIVICDDDNYAMKTLETKIRQFMKAKEAGYSLLSYQNSRQLDFDLEDTAKADVYILDIDMDGLKESGVIKAFDKKTAANIAREVLEKTEKKIYKTSFIPEISTNGDKPLSLNEFKEVMNERGYDSYVLK